MATVADVDLRGWTVQSSSPIRTGLYPSSVRPSNFDVPFGANRTSGVAPFGIVLAGGFNYSTASSKPFHHHHYSWDFGEVTGNTWAANGKSKDTDTGPVVAHVFENPGTYTVTCTVRDSSTGSTLRTETETITVTDPDVVFSGANTVVVNKVGDSDFTGAPSGATQVNSDDVQSVMTSHFDNNKRILFKRGSTWSVNSSVTLPLNKTQTYIGAYGTGTSPDARGIYANDPVMQFSGTDSVFPFDRQTDCRLVNITYTNATTLGGFAGGGNTGITNNLIHRCKGSGGSTVYGWSYFRSAANELNTGNIVSDSIAQDFEEYGFFGNGEHSAIIGCNFKNSATTHLCRKQQWYISCTLHNDLSGSSLSNTNGRQAIKMHGPKENMVGDFATTGGGGLANRTDFAVIANNVIGSSGPWPVSIGPQDTGSDERLTDILVEKNILSADFGQTSSVPVSRPLRCSADYATIRNNVIDGGSNTANDFTAIEVYRSNSLPNRTGSEVYSNTLFNPSALTNGSRGITVGAGTEDTILRNNLVSYTNPSTVFLGVVNDGGTNTTESNNSRIDDPLYTDPTNATPLSRDFTLQVGSTAIDAGTSVPVYDDLADALRAGTFELGAYQE